MKIARPNRNFDVKTLGKTKNGLLFEETLDTSPIVRPNRGRLPLLASTKVLPNSAVDNNMRLSGKKHGLFGSSFKEAEE
jgi:hypothetical protein